MSRPSFYRIWCLFKFIRENEFNLLFSEKNFFSIDYQDKNKYYALSPNQKINHFPNNYELTRKDLMYKNLRKFKKHLIKEGKTEEANEFDFYPITYYMPNEFVIFLSEYKKNPNQLWIMKPACKAQGRGIFIVTNLEQIQKWKSSLKGGSENLINEVYVIQKYLMNPLLICFTVWRGCHKKI